ncbi:MAG TPA: hypothetical protein VGH02_07760 [Rhizomicrobium sp.]|jgi:hypothetical protein
MYSQYVRDGSPTRNHNATILDAEIVYSNWIDRLPRCWWVAPLFIAACGLAGWFVTLPLD